MTLPYRIRVRKLRKSQFSFKKFKNKNLLKIIISFSYKLEYLLRIPSHLPSRSDKKCKIHNNITEVILHSCPHSDTSCGCHFHSMKSSTVSTLNNLSIYLVLRDQIPLKVEGKYQVMIDRFTIQFFDLYVAFQSTEDQGFTKVLTALLNLSDSVFFGIIDPRLRIEHRPWQQGQKEGLKGIEHKMNSYCLNCFQW